MIRALWIAGLISLSGTAHAVDGAQFRKLVEQAQAQPEARALLDAHLSGLLEGMNVVNFAMAPKGRTGAA